MGKWFALFDIDKAKILSDKTGNPIWRIQYTNDQYTHYYVGDVLPKNIQKSIDSRIIIASKVEGV